MQATSMEIIILFIILSSVIFLLLSAFIVYVIYKYKYKQNLHNIEIDMLKSAHANEILQAQLEMQEQTFIHIAREIHDNVGQKLTLAKLHLINIQEENFNEKLAETTVLIGNSISDLRDLSRTLSSDLILNCGLVAAIQGEILQIQKTNIFQVDFKIKGEQVFLNAKCELILFRIIQESLHNIIKHANATKVKILLSFSNGSLTIGIKDDGNGFDTKIKSWQGLKNIEARAKMLGGIFVIESEVQKGTTIKIQIQLNETNLTS